MILKKCLFYLFFVLLKIYNKEIKTKRDIFEFKIIHATLSKYIFIYNDFLIIFIIIIINYLDIYSIVT